MGQGLPYEENAESRETLRTSTSPRHS